MEQDNNHRRAKEDESRNSRMRSEDSRTRKRTIIREARKDREPE